MMPAWFVRGGDSLSDSVVQTVRPGGRELVRALVAQPVAVFYAE
ncbi:hypothetical protein PLANPX_3568 [Lacipirellula parvula]|uniref:Uncharacterized protein n=1 Tax=Lacipirellula parvula TaxID=2650471 RepID=A0A5K7XI41_9BACT|nr:hypothetical protein PLANPX_3568 [Lacipirellula parvula]